MSSLLGNAKVDIMTETTTKKIVVMSGKGGVGKSTVSANLAYNLSKRGYKVGVFDSDFHGPTIPRLMGVKDQTLDARGDVIIPVEVTPNLKVISMEFLLPDNDSPLIWRGPMKMNMINQLIEKVDWGTLDYLIVDLPPGTGDEPLSIAQQLKDVEGALIVTTPQEVSLDAVRKSINFARKLNMKIIGVIENMSDFKCPHCGEIITMFGIEGGKNMSEELEAQYLGSIPLNADIVGSGEKGLPFSDQDNKSAELFNEIVEKILNKIGDQK